MILSGKQWFVYAPLLAEELLLAVLLSVNLAVLADLFVGPMHVGFTLGLRLLAAGIYGI